jgi:hypothetical protein
VELGTLDVLTSGRLDVWAVQLSRSGLTMVDSPTGAYTLLHALAFSQSRNGGTDLP